MTTYKLISKTVFFPKEGIWAIGDLHLGYESQMLDQGLSLPLNQLERTKKEILQISQKIEKENIKKIILLGDIKHHFPFHKSELYEVRDFFEFLKTEFPKSEIITIKGNHDKIESYNQKYKDFHIENDLAFIHGDRDFVKIYDKKIKTIVMAHIHPAKILKDEQNIKREKFKSFLIGKYKRKQFTIVPSFFEFIKGTEINKDNFGIIPKDKLKKFDTFIVGKDNVYEFGRVD